MTAHRDLVAAFEAGLRSGTLPEGLTATAPDEVARRFAVYRNTVAVSLTDALAARFPVVRRLVGEGFFAAMARIYAEANRPRSPVLHDWGDSFAAFLGSFPPLAAYPYMADVARIDHARGQAFHAADASPVDPAMLARADAPQLAFPLHPSVRVLRLAHPAVSIWTMNQPDAKGGKIPSGPEIALILRDRAFDVPVRAIGTGDAAMIDAMQADASLTAAAEAAQAAEPGHNPAPLILHLVQAGALLTPKDASR